MARDRESTGTSQLKLDSSARRSLRDHVMDTLRDGILSGKLAQGEHLRERELAEQLGISTTPVKEALRKLEHEGLVVTHPRRGSFVSQFVGSVIEEMSVLRAALEGVAARLAAQKATGEDVEVLSRQLALMTELTWQGRAEPLSEANTRFHELIHKTAGSPYVARLVGTLRTMELGVRRRALASNDEADRGLREHRAVFEAIAAQDPEKAETAMRQHVTRTARFVTAALPEARPRE